MSDEFQAPEKKIYAFNNGACRVVADPMLLRGKLTTAALARGKTMAGIIAAANKVDLEEATEIEIGEAWSALDVLSEIAAESFQLVPFDPATGNGADMAHAIALVDHFYSWCEKKNQTPASPQTSTPPSESILATPATTPI